MVLKGEVNIKVIASPRGMKVTDVTAHMTIKPFKKPWIQTRYKRGCLNPIYDWGFQFLVIWAAQDSMEK